MKKILNTLFVAAVAGGLTVSSAFAATQGTEGATSSGSSQITCTIPKLVKITAVSDLAHGTFNGVAPFNQSDTVCIYSNLASGGTYEVLLTGTNVSDTPTAGFYVGLASTEQEIPYTVAFNDDNNTTGEQAVTHNTLLEALDGFSNVPDCSDDGGANANIHVTMTQAAMLAVRPGAYSGTLTILVAPE